VESNSTSRMRDVKMLSSLDDFVEWFVELSKLRIFRAKNT